MTIIKDIPDIVRPVKCRADIIYNVPDRAIGRNSIVTVRPEDVIRYETAHAEYFFSYLSPDERNTREGTSSIPARVAIVFNEQLALAYYPYRSAGELVPNYVLYDLSIQRVVRKRR